jgi:hypothetical protein
VADEAEDRAVGEQPPIAKQDRLAENDGGDRHVDWIAHIAIEAGNDEVLGRAIGAGVPSPCSAKRPNESTSPDTPARISAEPTKRVSSTPRNDNLNSQCEIHHGTTPATTQGTNTKKMAVPMTAAVLRMDTIHSLLL